MKKIIYFIKTTFYRFHLRIKRLIQEFRFECLLDMIWIVRMSPPLVFSYRLHPIPTPSQRMLKQHKRLLLQPPLAGVSFFASFFCSWTNFENKFLITDDFLRGQTFFYTILGVLNWTCTQLRSVKKNKWRIQSINNSHQCDMRLSLDSEKKITSATEICFQITHSTDRYHWNGSHIWLRWKGCDCIWI